MTTETDRPSVPSSLWPALLFCMVFPTLMSWVETRWIVPTPPEERSAFLGILFPVLKIVQFSFPLVYVLLMERGGLRPHGPRSRGVLFGIVFGLIVSAGAFVLYFAFLRGTDLLGDTPQKIREWLDKFGFDSVYGFLIFAAVISIPHSLLEEYYWRWFVFGRLRRLIPWPHAAVVSGLAFMSHHVVVLAYYLPGYFWLGVVPFSLCVAIGGAAWAWLYEKTDNLYAPWISHLVIDAAVMVIGWDMLMATP